VPRRSSRASRCCSSGSWTRTPPHGTAARAGSRSSLAADTETAADTEAPADPRTALLPEAEALLERFRARLGDAVVAAEPCFGDAVVRVKPDAWLQAARVAKNELGCDYLSFISGIDWMPTPVAEEDIGSGDTSAPVQPRETTYGVTGSDG